MVVTSRDTRGRHSHSLLDLSWQSVGYGVGTFGRQLVFYLALPLFTRLVPQEEYGVVAVVTALLSFINTLSNGGIPGATFRFYNDTSDDRERLRVLGSAQLLIIGYALIAALGLWFGAVPLSRTLLGGPHRVGLVRVVALLLFVQSIVNHGSTLLRLHVRPLANSLQAVCQIALQLGVALVLVAKYDMGVTGYWLGHLLGSCLGLALMAWLVRGAVTFRTTFAKVAEMAAYGLPLVPGTVSLWALRLCDRALVAKFAGLSDAAIYEVGYKVGMLVALAVGPLRAAWPQFAFSTMRDPGATRVYRNSLTFVAAGASFIALAAIIFREELTGALAPDTYAGAADVVPWVAAAQIAWAVYPVLSVGLKIAKRTALVSSIVVLAAVANIGANLLLLPVLGIRGAAIATLLGYGILAILTHLASRRCIPDAVDWVRLGGVGLSFGAIVLVSTLVDRLPPGIAVAAARSALLLSFPAMLVLTRVLSVQQCRQLPRRIWRRLRREHDLR